ncbi:MAG TPA: hypothetical protein VLL05_20490 [Terriglobales bacterium]|nr:hypothetical protein [Terriglobales bacterium]
MNSIKNKKKNLLQSLQEYGAITVKINRRTAKLPLTLIASRE